MRIALAVLLLSLPAAAAPRLAGAVDAELAQPAEREAAVMVALEVDATGTVTAATVIESGGDAIDEAALQAARRQRFAGGAASITVAYHFDAGATRAAPALLAAQPVEEVTIREASPAPEVAPQPVQFVIPAAEAARLPGTSGDAGKVVESLPGVARAAVGSGDVTLWGADPRQTRTYVDGVEVPALFHAGGWRSVIGASMIGAVAVAPGGYGATHGRGLGGIVDLGTAPVPAGGAHGALSIDPLDAAAAASYGAGPGLRVGGAARVSLIDPILGSAVAPSLGGLVAVPRYRDAQLKATLALSGRRELSFLALGATDATRLSVPAAPGVAERSDALDASFARLAARYQDGPGVEVVPWVGVEHERRALSAAGIPSLLERTSVEVGLRASTTAPLAGWLDGTVGFDGLVSHDDLSRAGSLTTPPREGDVTVFGQPPGSDVNADAWQVLEIAAAPFVTAEARLGPLTLIPGLRLETLGLDTSRRTPRVGATPGLGSSRLTFAADPRLAARVALGRGLALTASAGRYHQLPDPEDLSAVFGTPLLGAARARHATLGAELRDDALLVQLTTFLELADGLAARDPAATPPLAAVLTGRGQGRNAGAQLLVRVTRGGLVAWLGYTLSRAQRRDAPDQPWRLADFDQTHVATAVASLRLGRFTIGARARVASGVPRTPVVGAFADLSTGRFDPIFGPRASTRLPAFFSLDARVDRRFALGAVTVNLYLEVLNVTAHANAEERVYSSDYARSDLITGLPLLALLGARIGF